MCAINKRETVGKTFFDLGARAREESDAVDRSAVPPSRLEAAIEQDALIRQNRDIDAQYAAPDPGSRLEKAYERVARVAWYRGFDSKEKK